MTLTKQKSAIVSKRGEVNRNDQRVRRTLRRIDSAFVELLHRRAYGDIRVSDIVKKAAVGRPTFYAHYATKDDLLRSQFQRVVAPMVVATPAGSARLDATHFFAHVQSTQRIYKALMGRNSGTAPRVLRDCFEKRVRQALSLDSDCDSSLKQSATARFVASSLTAIIECWLENGARETPGDVQKIFAALVGPGLRS